jgi:hypothetical protein
MYILDIHFLILEIFARVNILMGEEINCFLSKAPLLGQGLHPWDSSKDADYKSPVSVKPLRSSRVCNPAVMITTGVTDHLRASSLSAQAGFVTLRQ